jgi:hypothetical protein
MTRSTLVTPVLLALLLLPALSSMGRCATLELPAVGDNTLFQDADGDTSNGVGASVFSGRNSQGRVRRGLFRFDLAAALPAGAVLDGARLALHLASSSDPEERAMRLHRVLTDWGEGGSASAGGSGAPAKPGDATWLHAFYPTTPWTTPGGDFAPTASASTTVLGEGNYAWDSEALTADVRAWLGAGAGNFGWILLGEESIAGTARRFDSRESVDPTFRPRLILQYSVPTPTDPASWGRLKAHFR